MTRIVILSTGILFGTLAFAQPYSVQLWGTIYGGPLNNTVTVVDGPGTLPAISLDIPVTMGIYTSAEITVTTVSGTFIISAPCNGGTLVDTVSYTLDPFFPDSTSVFFELNCNIPTTDCLGVIGGTSLPGNPCDDGDPLTVNDTYQPNCSCVGMPPGPCSVWGYMTQSMDITNSIPIPFTASAYYSASGGAPPYTFSFDCGDGSAPTSDTSHTYANAGNYTFCITLNTGNGCMSTYCDSVVVSADGWVNGYTIPVCETSMGVAQAWTWADSIGGLPGGQVPTPNLLWIHGNSAGQDPITYTWDFGDGTTSTDQFPTHFYPTGGPYVLCLTTTDDTLCTNTVCDTLSVDGDGILQGIIGHANTNRSGFTIQVLGELPTAIEAHESPSEVDLWPNPAADAIILSFNGSHSGRLEISIIDLNGRLVKSMSNAIAKGNNLTSLPVSELESGLYLVRISDGNNVTSRRFVKQ